MFVPNLDEGSEWENIEIFSSPTDLFNVHHFIDLNFKSDALQIDITTSVFSAKYKFGGELFQLWSTPGGTYQVGYKKLWMDNKNIIAIEPVANCRLLYHPPTYLRNWTINVKARRYEAVSNNSEVDLTEVTNNLNSLATSIDESFRANRDDLGEIAANNVQERSQIVGRLQQLDAGIYTLAEGIADLLPGSQGEQLRQNTQNRLDLDLGFL